VVTVSLGIPAAGRTEAVDMLQTNLDDVTGETLGYVIAQALKAGALDAWVTPAVMKKGRPAHILHVLTHPERTAALQEMIFTETGALGIRRASLTRTMLRRRTSTVDLDGVKIRIKRGPYGTKPEHDDLAAAAARKRRGCCWSVMQVKELIARPSRHQAAFGRGCRSSGHHWGQRSTDVGTSGTVDSNRSIP
jgi:uncharacterized protein (DUF111 family)